MLAKYMTYEVEVWEHTGASICENDLGWSFLRSNSGKESLAIAS
jgi:hypothetical protein